ncbi:MAG TPA: regulatory iron-sulfur-containing complex subunit RicT [Desulfatiglandales bacterium]|nr:regulatory iron-sulfur-containing complex subunit RicT [Desulfatiglandales bacterium]
MNENSPKKIVNISFRKDGRIYEFYTGNFVLNEGDKVIVETKKGIELGTVCSKPRLRDSGMPSRPIKKIFRLATPEDIEKKKENESIEKEAMQYCKDQIEHKKLPMNLIAAELSFERSKLIFFYISASRVDFRELVKDLIQKFNTHVEMRQIGTRDLARMLGGIGHCGLELCCSRFLSNFAPISIRMAKEQDLSLNPGKISGICGRLMCCLAFECEMYKEMKKNSRDNNDKQRKP